MILTLMGYGKNSDDGDGCHDDDFHDDDCYDNDIIIMLMITGSNWGEQSRWRGGAPWYRISCSLTPGYYHDGGDDGDNNDDD